MLLDIMYTEETMTFLPLRWLANEVKNCWTVLRYPAKEYVLFLLKSIEDGI